MGLSAGEKNKLAILRGVAKSTISEIPVIKQIVDGYESYKIHQFEKAVEEVISYLQNKVDNPNELLSNDWIQSEPGKQFARKVLDCAVDAQLEDKRELFINALINGAANTSMIDLEKLKFIDILRHTSRVALNILAELHIMYKDKVRRPGQEQRIDAPPYINKETIVDELNLHYNPYLIESSLTELISAGLFSPNIEYFKQPNGKYRVGSGLSDGNYVYTDYTCRFVEFITINTS